MAFEAVKETGGTLFVVATPIGNLDDLTYRAVKCLETVDLIACEDTRRTARLLNHLGLHKPLLSCFEHNEASRVDEILAQVAAGRNVALVSDAGTPTISDPGFVLVRAARERGFRVVPIPGPSAVIAALSASGLPTDQFLFAGFLPRTAKARRDRIAELKDVRATLVFYEAPHRVLEALADLRAGLSDRDAFLAREATKVHEEYVRAPLSELEAALRAKPGILGEIVLVVAGAPDWAQPSGSLDDAFAHFDAQTARGATPRQAAKEAARLTGLDAREIYSRVVARRRQPPAS